MTLAGPWSISAGVLVLAGALAVVPRHAAAVADLSGDWDKRYSPTSRGTPVLNRIDGVYFYDPAFDPNVVRKITNSLTADTGSGFTLGSGALANQVIAAWRNGTEFAYFWMQTLLSTTLNAATGPFNYPSPLDANVNLNPELGRSGRRVRLPGDAALRRGRQLGEERLQGRQPDDRPGHQPDQYPAHPRSAQGPDEQLPGGLDHHGRDGDPMLLGFERGVTVGGGRRSC